MKKTDIEDLLPTLWIALAIIVLLGIRFLFL